VSSAARSRSSRVFTPAVVAARATGIEMSKHSCSRQRRGEVLEQRSRKVVVSFRGVASVQNDRDIFREKVGRNVGDIPAA